MMSYYFASIALIAAVAARIMCAEEFEDLAATEHEHSVLQWCRALSEVAILACLLVMGIKLFAVSL